MEWTNTGVRSEHIYFAESCKRRVHQLLPGRRLTYIGFHPDGALPETEDLRRDLLSGRMASMRSIVVTPVINHDVGPMPRALNGDGPTDTARAAGDDHDFPFKQFSAHRGAAMCTRDLGARQTPGGPALS